MSTHQQISEKRTVVRKCSYCNMAGHNVSSCMSPALLCYLAHICTKYKRILEQVTEALTQRQALCIAAGRLKIYLMNRTNTSLKETMCALVRNLKLITTMPSYENACYLMTKYILRRYTDNIYPRHIYPHHIPLNEVEIYTRVCVHYGRNCREMDEYNTFEITDNIIPFINHFQITNTIPRQICKVAQVEGVFSETFECPICYEVVNERCVLTDCGHKYCRVCFYKIKKIAEANGVFPNCAMCRCEIKKCEVSCVKNNNIEDEEKEKA